MAVMVTQPSNLVTYLTLIRYLSYELLLWCQPNTIVDLVKMFAKFISESLNNAEKTYVTTITYRLIIQCFHLHLDAFMPFVFLRSLVKVKLVHTRRILFLSFMFPDSKVHGANIEPTWVLSAPDEPHVGPMNLAISVRWLPILPLHVGF